MSFLFVIVSFFIVLLLFFVLYNRFVLNYYTTDYFDVDFSNDWDVFSSNLNGLSIKNKNNSTIQIFGKEVNYDNEKIDDVYFDLEEKFVQQNKDLNLINYDSTNVGKDYYDAYEYLYSYEGYQTMLILLLNGDKVVYVVYTSSS